MLIDCDIYIIVVGYIKIQDKSTQALIYVNESDILMSVINTCKGISRN